MEGFKEIEDESIDMILTDIPYDGVNKYGAERAKYKGQIRDFNKEKADVITFNLNNFIKECIRVTKGSIYIFCGLNQISLINEIYRENDLSTRLVIWEKTNPTPVNGQHLWLNGVEVCCFGRKSGATFNEHCKNTVLRFPSGQRKIHPTEKPLELFKELILISSNKKDTILDPCIGSGTTAIACYKTDRNYIGFEKDKEYYEKCIENVTRNTSQMKLF